MNTGIKPDRLDQRICDALMLQPMTVEQLAACLSMIPMTIRKHVRAMRYAGQIVGVNINRHATGRPWVRYSIRRSA
jgi:predicted ArsR family transcriptional regulator